MPTKIEDVDVTKLVELVSRIPKHFSLNFSKFSTNFYVFSKFTVLKFKHILQFDPWRFWFFSNEVPGWDSEQGREGRDVSRRWGWPAARGKWGKMERGSRATLGRSWEERRWSELGSPR